MERNNVRCNKSFEGMGLYCMPKWESSKKEPAKQKISKSYTRTIQNIMDQAAEKASE